MDFISASPESREGDSMLAHASSEQGGRVIWVQEEVAARDLQPTHVHMLIAGHFCVVTFKKK